MALERQITFQVNVNNTIDDKVNQYLKDNEVDPAGVQVVVDGGKGIKTATLSYGSREAIKAAYESQGRQYSDSDAVTYCYAKDIIASSVEELDTKVNEFLSDENVSAISISRYVTVINNGAFIFYVNVAEQKEKMEQKKKEVEKAQEELAQKLATSAVKDVDLDSNETVEKYADMTQEDKKETEEPKTEVEPKVSTEKVKEETKKVEVKKAETKSASKKPMFRKNK